MGSVFHDPFMNENATKHLKKCLDYAYLELWRHDPHQDSGTSVCGVFHNTSDCLYWSKNLFMTTMFVRYDFGKYGKCDFSWSPWKYDLRTISVNMLL